jgi:hypothetical protein
MLSLTRRSRPRGVNGKIDIFPTGKYEELAFSLVRLHNEC